MALKPEYLLALGKVLWLMSALTILLVLWLGGSLIVSFALKHSMLLTRMYRVKFRVTLEVVSLPLIVVFLLVLVVRGVVVLSTGTLGVGVALVVVLGMLVVTVVLSVTSSPCSVLSCYMVVLFKIT